MYKKAPMIETDKARSYTNNLRETCECINVFRARHTDTRDTFKTLSRQDLKSKKKNARTQKHNI